MTNWKGLPRVRELSNTLPLVSYGITLIRNDPRYQCSAW